MTYSANEAPLAGVLQELAAQAGVSVVLSKELSESVVSVEFVDVPAQMAFQEVGRIAGRSPVLREGLVTFPELSAANRDGYAVIDPGHLSPEAASAALKTLMGSDGECTTVGQRVVVVGTWEAVRKSAEFASQFGVGPDGWALEVRLVRVTDALERALGLGWNVSGAVGLSVDAGTGHLPGSWPVLGARGRAVVEVLGRAAAEGRGAELVQEGRVFVLEGEQASMQVGETTPVARRTVSPEGTVSVTGYESVRTGFLLTAGARRVPGGVRLDLEPSVSSIAGFVEGAPIVTESTVKSTVVVEDGGWVVLSGLATEEASETVSGLPGGLSSRVTSQQERRASASRLMLLVRAERVWAGKE